MQIAALSASSGSWDFINKWEDTLEVWGSCQAAPGEEGVQELLTPRCLGLVYGVGGYVHAQKNDEECIPALADVRQRTCAVARLETATFPTCTFYNGTCWFLSDLGDSCDAACAQLSLHYDDYSGSLVGSASPDSVPCQRVLNLLLDVPAIKWQQWDISPEILDADDFDPGTMEFPYNQGENVPIPTRVSSPYGVGCMLTDNSVVLGYYHPWVDTSETTGSG